MKLKQILTLALLLIAMTATAQNSNKVRFGLEDGLNLANFTGSEIYNLQMRAGFNIGMTIDIPINDFLGIKTGVQYTIKGWKLEDTINEYDDDYGIYDDNTYVKEEKYLDKIYTEKFYSGYDYDEDDDDFYEYYYYADEEYKLTIGYLEVPVLVQYRLNLTDNLQLQVNAGPYIAVALHGKAKETDTEYGWEDYEDYYNTRYEYDVDYDDLADYTTTSREYEYESTEDIVGKKGHKRIDFGFVLPSVGIVFNKLYFGITNEFGLINIADNYGITEFKAHNYNLSFNIGVKF